MSAARLPQERFSPRFPRLPAVAAHYESLYLKAVHPEGGRAIWLRHTVLQRPGEAATGAVWLTVFDRDAPGPWALKQGGAPAAPRGGGLTIGGCRADVDRAQGRIEAAGRRASWDLRLTGDEPPAHHLPTRRLYEASLPRTKSLSPCPAARLTGRLERDDTRLELDGWHAMVGHNWGSEHAEWWIWLHGEHADGWLDVALGRVRVGPVLVPWLATGNVCLGGRRHRVLPGPRPVRRATPERAELVLRAGGRRLGVTVHAPRAAAVAWRYASPDGGERLAVNCSVADGVLVVGDRRIALDARVAYELGRPAGARHDGIARAPFSDPCP